MFIQSLSKKARCNRNGIYSYIGSLGLIYYSISYFVLSSYHLEDKKTGLYCYKKILMMPIRRYSKYFEQKCNEQTLYIILGIIYIHTYIYIYIYTYIYIQIHIYIYIYIYIKWSTTFVLYLKRNEHIFTNDTMRITFYLFLKHFSLNLFM